MKLREYFDEPFDLTPIVFFGALNRLPEIRRFFDLPLHVPGDAERLSIENETHLDE